MRLCRFDTPSRSIFIIFQEEYRGPKRKFLIRGAPKCLQTLFVIGVLNCTILFTAVDVHIAVGGGDVVVVAATAAASSSTLVVVVLVKYYL